MQYFNVRLSVCLPTKLTEAAPRGDWGAFPLRDSNVGGFEGFIARHNSLVFNFIVFCKAACNPLVVYFITKCTIGRGSEDHVRP